MNHSQSNTESYKAGVGKFKVFLAGYMHYVVREGMAGPVVDSATNLSEAFGKARRLHEVRS